MDYFKELLLEAFRVQIGCKYPSIKTYSTITTTPPEGWLSPISRDIWDHGYYLHPDFPKSFGINNNHHYITRNEYWCQGSVSCWFPPTAPIISY